jgi:beta-galactosidase
LEFREISYTTEGLFINKEFVEIKGVCEHQDFAVVGTAISKEIVRYKLEKLKRMRVNAYRSAHHPASEEL